MSLPSINIDKVISDQKEHILDDLIKETKIPITNVEKHSFDTFNKKGEFEITINDNTRKSVNFQYKNGKFDIYIDKSVKDKLWEAFCMNNAAFIKTLIEEQLSIPIDIPIRMGISNIIYVLEEDTKKDISISCEFDGMNWDCKKKN